VSRPERRQDETARSYIVCWLAIDLRLIVQRLLEARVAMRPRRSNTDSSFRLSSSMCANGPLSLDLEKDAQPPPNRRRGYRQDHC
jgi:hypothetical protein